MSSDAFFNAGLSFDGLPASELTAGNSFSGRPIVLAAQARWWETFRSFDATLAEMRLQADGEPTLPEDLNANALQADVVATSTAERTPEKAYLSLYDILDGGPSKQQGSTPIQTNTFNNIFRLQSCRTTTGNCFGNPALEETETKRKVDPDLSLLLPPALLPFLPQWVANNLPSSSSTGSWFFEDLGDGNGKSVSIKASEGMEQIKALIQRAYQLKRPLRVDIDTALSVILKFKGGKVHAEFLTEDAQQLSRLQPQLAALRKRLEANQLPVEAIEARTFDSNTQQQGHSPNSDTEQA